MLEEFLKDIYDKAFALELLKETSYYSMIRQPYRILEIWNQAVESLGKMIEDLRKTDEKQAFELFESVRRARGCFNDPSGFSSILDRDVIPIVSEYLMKNGGIDVDDGFRRLLSSETGFLTLKDKNGMFIHSCSDPMWENFLYAQNIYDPFITRYNLLGGGLGYLAYQLWRLSDKEADIYIYEIDDNIADYSYHYGVASWIDEDHIHVIRNDNKDIVIEKYFEENADVRIKRTIYYWNQEDYTGPYSRYIETTRSSEYTSRVFDQVWKRNYAINRSLKHFSFSEFNSADLKDEWVVVAAGPSLNDNAQFIEESAGKRTICAVNTSLKWFSLHDIKPDICFACDANKPLIAHIEPCTEFSRSIPLIADYITNHNFLELYEGPRYYIPSDAASQIIDEEFEKSDVWSYGGTVTSMAIEAALRMKAKKLFLIGADLSYPGRTTYAEGVGKSVEQWESDDTMIVSVEDTWVPTSKSFSEYVLQIEDQIAGHPDCMVINRSLHGAYIKGTYCGKWWENLPETGSLEKYISYFDELKKDSLILGWREKYYIFQQAVYRLESDGIIPGDLERAAIDGAYKAIFDGFKRELEVNVKSGAATDDNLTYIITDEFWDADDEQTLNVLKTAVSEAENNRKVLIINTSEKLGGTAVPIRNAVPVKYNRSMENATTVEYGDHIFSYFQFSAGMPNLDYYRVFMDTLSCKKPKKICINSRYSLLADYCALTFNIRVERINNQ